MGQEGIEPSSCWFSVNRSDLLSYYPVFGEGRGIWTLDSLIKSQVLYRLSYTLIEEFLQNSNCVVGVEGIEPSI